VRKVNKRRDCVYELSSGKTKRKGLMGKEWRINEALNREGSFYSASLGERK